MSILAEVSQDEKSRAVEHWIERFERAARQRGDLITPKRIWPTWFRVIIFREFDAKDLLDTL
jgi:hypothetical protein